MVLTRAFRLKKSNLGCVVTAMLLSLSACMNQSPDALQRELFKAIDAGDARAVERLLREGANIENRSLSGATPLILAAEVNDAAMVKLLLEHGANPLAEDQNHETALIQAARSGSAETVAILIKRITDPKARTNALLTAARAGAVGVVSIEGPASSRPEAIQETREVKTIKVLLDAGVPVDSREEYDASTPLIEAASHGNLESVQFLLKRGAAVDAVDNYGNTALIGASCECAQATMRSTYEIVELLLDKGANVNARAQDGTTPLMSAAGGMGPTKTVELLLQHRADSGARDNDGKTALDIAVEHEKPEVAELLRNARKQR